MTKPGKHIRFRFSITGYSVGKETVVMATHAIELALEIADQLVVMKSGTFLKAGTTQDLVANQTIEQAFAGKNVSFDAEQKKFLVNW